MLLDLHMPLMDGFEVVRAIRAHEETTGRHLPIVALTARSSKRDRERCLAAGMDDFLSKPIEADALWAAVDRVLLAFPPAKPRESRLWILARSSARVEVGPPSSRGSARYSNRAFLTRWRGYVPRFATMICRACARPRTCFTAPSAPSRPSRGPWPLTIEDSAIREDVDSCAELVDRLESMCSELLEDTRTLTIDGLSL